jgi:hypothetical protein
VGDDDDGDNDAADLGLERGSEQNRQTGRIWRVERVDLTLHLELARRADSRRPMDHRGSDSRGAGGILTEAWAKLSGYRDVRAALEF